MTKTKSTVEDPKTEVLFQKAIAATASVTPSRQKLYRIPTVLVTAKENNIGHIVVKPKSPAICKEIKEHRASMKERPESDVYLQSYEEIESFMAEVPKRHRSELKKGWDVTFRINEEFFNNLVGFDYGS